jgi:hypothetical protein
MAQRRAPRRLTSAEPSGILASGPVRMTVKSIPLERSAASIAPASAMAPSLSASVQRIRLTPAALAALSCAPRSVSCALSTIHVSYAEMVAASADAGSAASMMSSMS